MSALGLKGLPESDWERKSVRNMADTDINKKINADFYKKIPIKFVSNFLSGTISIKPSLENEWIVYIYKA